MGALRSRSCELILTHGILKDNPSRLSATAIFLRRQQDGGLFFSESVHKVGSFIIWAVKRFSRL